tara:strand:- start:8663 stop:10300 length:1638 start_codon:yes stop_codon:yes gene_type:complete
MNKIAFIPIQIYFKYEKSLRFSVKRIVLPFIFTILCKISVFSQNTDYDLPNIIYVLVDDMGYGDVQAFNSNGKIPTPNINRLAQEGMKFTDAHTSSAVCTPTRYGILTGRYNWRSPLKSNTLVGNSSALIPTNRTTIASLLKRKNYNTAFIGKWHLGWDWQYKNENSDSTAVNYWKGKPLGDIDFSRKILNSPNDLGFDYMYGIAASLDMAPYVYVENSYVVEVPDKLTEGIGKYGWWRSGPTSTNFVHQEVTPLLFEKSYGYIKEKANKSSPFFLYLALPSPHTPILPTPEWQGKSHLNPYGDFIMEIDSYVGKLVKLLETMGVSKNTLIVFTSDNGCYSGAGIDEMKEKGHSPSYVYRGSKADIYEGGHREPFIIKWPAMVSAGKTSEATICTTDFMATCADILDIKLADDEGEDSFSLMPLMLGKNSKGYQRTYTVHHSINGSFAIRQGDWKLIFCPGSGGWSNPRPNSNAEKSLPKYQLYNLVNDPGERDNLYAKYPKIISKLKKLMQEGVVNGRSTLGINQENDLPMDGKKWTQIETIFN